MSVPVGQQKNWLTLFDRRKSKTSGLGTFRSVSQWEERIVSIKTKMMAQVHLMAQGAEPLLHSF